MKMNPEVSDFLNQLNHPLREQIEKLRELILNAQPGLEENVKWNGPNYTYNTEDRITLRINPLGSLNMILHLGAKKIALDRPLIKDESNLLMWKSNDRATIELKKPEQFQAALPHLDDLIKRWISSASE